MRLWPDLSRWTKKAVLILIVLAVAGLILMAIAGYICSWLECDLFIGSNRG